MNKQVSSRYAKETVHKRKNVFNGIMYVKYNVLECTYNHIDTDSKILDRYKIK